MRFIIEKETFFLVQRYRAKKQVRNALKKNRRKHWIVVLQTVARVESSRMATDTRSATVCL